MSNVAYTSRIAAPEREPEAALKFEAGCYCYLILYARSPSALLDDSIFSPALLPIMLTKPRTVCGCQPVAFMISARVAPFARFMSAITSAFLLARSALGLLPGLAAVGFFALALAGLRLLFGCSVAVCGVAPLSMVSLLIDFLHDRAAIVTIHHSGREKKQAEPAALRGGPNAVIREEGQLAADSLFYRARQKRNEELLPPRSSDVNLRRLPFHNHGLGEGSEVHSVEAVGEYGTRSPSSFGCSEG